MSVEKLVGGVSRFRSEVYPGRQEFFEQLALGQKPETLFITCADSRIDPCLLTQTHPGELFICRVIGNIVPPYPDAIGGVSATVEYAVGVLEVRSVIVCGHTDCGVMKGAMNPEPLKGFPNVYNWLGYAETGPRELDILAMTENNVKAQLKNLATHPQVIRRLADGTLKLHGWLYDLGAGTVTSYNEITGAFEPLSTLHHDSNQDDRDMSLEVPPAAGT
jgi:carbonic anhydrase